MDPETPRTLGDIEDSEPERREPGRAAPAKKSLDQFLAEFEERLLNHPGEPATSASAALLGRAEGVWRTPIEGGERLGRRLARRPGSRATPPQPAVMEGPATRPTPVPPAPEPVSVPTVDPPQLAVAASEGEPAPAPAAPAATTETAESEAGPGRRRNKRHRRHRRR